MTSILFCVSIICVPKTESHFTGNRSLMDRTPDSDSGNAGSIPAGCIFSDISGKLIISNVQERFASCAKGAGRTYSKIYVFAVVVILAEVFSVSNHSFVSRRGQAGTGTFTFRKVWWIQMGSSDKNTPSNEGLNKVVAFLQKNIKYISAGVLLLILVFVVIKFAGPSGESDLDTPQTEAVNSADDTQTAPEQPQAEKYEVDAYQPVNDLISRYYAAYAAGDIDSLSQLVKPISDNEKSYIQMFSQYVESYQNLKCYTKKGITENSYLVSAYIEVKFLNVDTVGPSLDFFYVQADENGALYIDNSYSPYNDKTNEYERNPDIKAKVDTFEEEEDVLALRQEVLEKYNGAKVSDENLNTVVSALGTAISEWKKTVVLPGQSSDTQQPEQPPASENNDQQPEELPTNENNDQQPEEPSQTLYVKEGVRMRAAASTESEVLELLETGAAVTKTGEEGEWTAVSYNGKNGYVKTEFLSETEVSAPQQEENNTNTAAGSLAEGSVITVSGAVNIRASMSETSEKVGIAFDGEKLTVIMSYAEGWTKVKWNDKTGYVKTDLLQ